MLGAEQSQTNKNPRVSDSILPGSLIPYEEKPMQRLSSFSSIKRDPSKQPLNLKALEFELNLKSQELNSHKRIYNEKLKKFQAMENSIRAKEKQLDGIVHQTSLNQTRQMDFLASVDSKFYRELATCTDISSGTKELELLLDFLSLENLGLRSFKAGIRNHVDLKDLIECSCKIFTDKLMRDHNKLDQYIDAFRILDRGEGERYSVSTAGAFGLVIDFALAVVDLNRLELEKREVLYRIREANKSKCPLFSQLKRLEWRILSLKANVTELNALIKDCSQALDGENNLTPNGHLNEDLTKEGTPFRLNLRSEDEVSSISPYIECGQDEQKKKRNITKRTINVTSKVFYSSSFERDFRQKGILVYLDSEGEKAKVIE